MYYFFKRGPKLILLSRVSTLKFHFLRQRIMNLVRSTVPDLLTSISKFIACSQASCAQGPSNAPTVFSIIVTKTILPHFNSLLCSSPSIYLTTPLIHFTTALIHLTTPLIHLTTPSTHTYHKSTGHSIAWRCIFLTLVMLQKSQQELQVSIQPWKAHKRRSLTFNPRRCNQPSGSPTSPFSQSNTL